MNLRELIDTVRDEGYSQANAEARVCQDIPDYCSGETSMK